VEKHGAESVFDSLVRIFYEDRARNLWGKPTGFLYKAV
jgi:hypothetical protein